ncbi:polyhydroxyalkanoate synthesis regulator [Paenibacillus validus]|uniref:Polyhydroxyalkanoate synthesis regulator n=1 Tax=Paenibacillus validus TaxID=44253 RepID=A0A7X2ZCC3_9BACL|nr:MULTISPECIES: polyhydroxyalkanoate synthesis regulator [Paenibacillus]MED4602687.1 polyhydroxyalkanoate synthesis regulator [Paenibacillus validus]MED4609079.1 polyhydroxyalkanoate synthesis regulator [Paenibacillus validus]MUG72359.1 polyhydroxyalkanoate synthesis regulator [Paenibacillus validus]
MNELLKKALSLGLGVTILSKEKLESAVDELVKKGNISANESKELVNRLIEKGEAEQAQLKQLIREQLNSLLAELHVATKEDIENLSKRLEKLENNNE